MCTACECIECGARPRRGKSLFCGRKCRNGFAMEMVESIACAFCDSAEDGVIDALRQGWRDIIPDPEGHGHNYLGVCPTCVRLT